MDNRLTLREWRNAKEITKKKMADACGIHENTYAKWEEDPKKIPIGQAFVIARTLGVDIDQIIFSPNSTKRSDEMLTV